MPEKILVIYFDQETIDPKVNFFAIFLGINALN